MLAGRRRADARVGPRGEDAHRAGEGGGGARLHEGARAGHVAEPDESRGGERDGGEARRVDPAELRGRGERASGRRGGDRGGRGEQGVADEGAGGGDVTSRPPPL